MHMFVEYNTVFAYVAGIILLYILGRYLVVPMKNLLKLVYNGLSGNCHSGYKFCGRKLQLPNRIESSDGIYCRYAGSARSTYDNNSKVSFPGMKTA